MLAFPAGVQCGAGAMQFVALDASAFFAGYTCHAPRIAGSLLPVLILSLLASANTGAPQSQSE